MGGGSGSSLGALVVGGVGVAGRPRRLHRRAPAGWYAIRGGLVLLVLLILGLVSCAVPASAASDPTTTLADRYAPIVVVREQAEPCGEGEPYRPTTVETVLAQQGVVLRGPGGAEVRAPTAQDIAGKGPAWYLDYPGNPLAPGCTYETWFRKTSVGVEPTLYARVAADPKHPGEVALQYWFFYPYNDWNDKHEGDWEMVQIVLPASSAEQALGVTPESVAFAQHEGSQVSPWTGPGLVKVGDHPVVYPGQGSHAAYYAQERWFGKGAAAGFGCDNTTPPGLEVTPRVVLLPSGPPPTSGDFAWLSFTGHWGQEEPSVNNGPTGPITKSQWSEPVTWMQERGRSGAVSLPPVPGIALTEFCVLTSSGSLLFVDLLDRPALVIACLLAVILGLVVLVRLTRWRHAHPEQPDRQRRAGQIVTGGFGWARRHLPALAGTAGVLGAAFVLAALVNTALQPRRDPGDITGAGLRPGWVASVVLALVALVVLAVTGWVVARVIGLVRDDADGRATGGRDGLRVAAHEWVAILTAALVLLAAGALTGTIVLIPLAAWGLGTYGIAPAVAVVEGASLGSAFRRSAQLTRQHRWRTLAVQATLLVMGTGIASVLGAGLLLATNWPFWVIGSLTLVALLVLLPGAFAGIGLQYYDLRQRHPANTSGGPWRPEVPG